MPRYVAFSLATQKGFGSLTYGFDLSQYKLIGNSLYITIFIRTLAMAAIGSLLTIAVGYPIAYWMARYLSTYKLLALLLIVVPFWTSFLIRTYALKIILDPNGYLAKDLGISDVTLRNWIRQERTERGERPGGLSRDEREELKRLRDENARLRMEREILSKAAVLFAKESDGR